MRISVAINIFYNISVTKLKRHFNVYWISAAGIPDFRSPGTGLYDNLQEYNLPSPQAIFELEFFKENPEPFFKLAKALWPGIFKVLLFRCYKVCGM